MLNTQTPAIITGRAYQTTLRYLFRWISKTKRWLLPPHTFRQSEPVLRILISRLGTICTIHTTLRNKDVDVIERHCLSESSPVVLEIENHDIFVLGIRRESAVKVDSIWFT